MTNYTTITSDKDRKKTLIICAIGGIFGAHHYYVGRIGTGLLYTFTAGLFIFGWIADLIRISTGSFRDNSGQPLRK